VEDWRKEKEEDERRKEEDERRKEEDERRKRKESEEWKSKPEENWREEEEEKQRDKEERTDLVKKDFKQEDKKPSFNTGIQKLLHYVVVEGSTSLKICFIQDSTLLIPTNSIWKILKSKAEKKHLKLEKVHSNEFCKPNEQPTNKVWDVSIYIALATEHMEWNEMIPKLEQIRRSTKHMVFIILAETTEQSKLVRAKEYDGQPSNVFILLVNRTKKELHSTSEYELGQENLLIDYLLQISEK